MSRQTNTVFSQDQSNVEPWREKYLTFGQPCIGELEKQFALECIDSLWLGTGPRVEEFERSFARYIGSPYAVAVNSGTAALELAIKVLDIEVGSEVLLPSLTFCATANAVIHNGLVPVFVDSNPDSMNIDVEDCARKITKLTRAIIPVHFAGRPCEMSGLLELAKKHNLHLVEDCAHAIEATSEGVHCGNFGNFGCFSFYVTKNITTVEGGMVVCKNEEQANRIKVCALHGLSKDAWSRFSDDGYKHYQVIDDGHKFNMTDLSASLGLAQLARIEEFRARRKKLWNYYLEALSDLPLTLPAPVSEKEQHAYHLFTCLLNEDVTSVNRDEVLEQLHQLRIGAGVHYIPLHLHSYYRDRYNLENYSFPVAESIGRRTFSIPLSAAVTMEDAKDVVQALRYILTKSFRK